METHIFPFRDIWLLSKIFKLKNLCDPSSSMGIFTNILARPEYIRKKVNTNMNNYCLLMDMCIRLYNENKEVWNEMWNAYMEYSEKEKSEQKYIQSCELAKHLYLMMENIKDKTVHGYCEDYDGHGIALVLRK